MLVELVIAGRHRAGAEVLLERYADPEERLTFVSAAHALIEGASALRRLVRERLIDVADGWQALRSLGELDVVLDASTPRLARIWELRDRMSAYDAAYAAAAEAVAAPLLTTDRRLLRACMQERIPAQHLDDLATSELSH